MKIFIVGFMGSGKSVIGRKLAGLTGLPFLDLDQEFERQYKITIENFFNKYSENVFRTLEAKILRQTVTITSSVISTGGGTPCYYENMDFMNETGKTIYLKVSPEALHSRILSSHKPRPLLMGLSEDQMLEKMKSMLAEREKFYQKSSIVIPADLVDLPSLVRTIKMFEETNS